MQRADVEGRKCPACAAELCDAEASAAVCFPSLDEAQKRLEYLYTTKKRMDEFMNISTTGVGVLVKGDVIDSLVPRFAEAMDDDFNAAAALGVLGEIMRLANEVMDNKEGHPAGMLTSTVQVLQKELAGMGDVLGVLERAPDEALKSLQERARAGRDVDEEEVERLITARAEARKAKDFSQADVIRDQLAELGVEIKDTPSGTTWKICG